MDVPVPVLAPGCGVGRIGEGFSGSNGTGPGWTAGDWAEGFDGGDAGGSAGEVTPSDGGVGTVDGGAVRMGPAGLAAPPGL